MSPSCEFPPETTLVDRLEWQRAARDLRRESPGRLHDVPPAAVTHRHLHLQARICRGQLFARGHACLQLDAQRVAIADETQTHLVLVEVVDLAIHGFEEQLHQTIHFDGRPLPVLARECEQRECADTAPRAFLYAHAHRTHAFLVAGMARKASCLGPSPVAIHNDRDVLRSAHGRRQRVERLPAHTCRSSFSLAASWVSMSRDVFVGQLLDVDLGLLFFILRDQLFLERLFHVRDHVAAHVAHGDARILGVGSRHLGDVLAALFGERRQRNADYRASADIGLRPRSDL